MKLLHLRCVLPAAFCVVAVATLGCGGGTAADVDYSVSAKENYDHGMDALDSEEWIAAVKYFSFIKARFPYSRFASLAELRLADAEFGAGQHVEAIDDYKMFIKLHPTHEMVVNGYASYRIAAAYIEMLPSDFWLLPPSHEKDQSATSDAHRELSQFLRKHADSKYAAEAKELLDKVNRRLAAHEWYVANFYWEREEPMGTVLRLRRLLDRHGGVGYDSRALLLLGQAYVQVGMTDRARAAFEQLVKEHPDDDNAEDAREALSSIGSVAN